MEYRVTWVIDVEADGPTSAAVKARIAQLRPNTTATVFTVVAREGGEDAGLADEVDLAEVRLAALDDGSRDTYTL